MPSGHRTSPSSGRRAESGSSPRLFSVPSSHTDAYAAMDDEQRLRDELSRVTTALNQANAENEKYKYRLEQAKKRSSISINTSSTVRQPTSVQDLKEQVNFLEQENVESEDEIKQWKADYEALQRSHSSIYREQEDKISDLRRENKHLKEENDRLQKLNDSLNVAYTHLSEKHHTSQTSKLPERPKERGQKEYYPDSGGSRDKSKRKEDRDQNKRLSDRFEPDRGRGSGRERESRESRPPVTKTKRRDSYVEGWGPPAAPRATSRSRHSTPRNAPNLDPLRSPGAYSSGSGGSAIDSTEDGNYHPYPVGR